MLTSASGSARATAEQQLAVERAEAGRAREHFEREKRRVSDAARADGTAALSQLQQAKAEVRSKGTLRRWCCKHLDAGVEGDAFSSTVRLSSYCLVGLNC